MRYQKADRGRPLVALPFALLALVLLALVLLMTATTLSASLRAGVARRDITPPLEARMGLWGYGGRDEPAQGVLDPLYARVLVIRGDTGSFALVTLDLGRTFDTALLEPLRQDLEKAAQLDAVVFSASHTHAAPNVQPASLAAPAASEWARAALERIRSAVLEAAAAAQPVRIGFATGTSWIGNNRRFLRPDGSVQMISRDSPKFRNFPVDPSVRVLRLDRADGTPLAVVVHYSCHPVTLGDKNLKYSADWPGAMMRAIEEEVPGHPLAVYVQGAPGDINLMEPLAGKSGEQEVIQIGQSIGKEAAAVARSIQTTAPGRVEVKCLAREFSFPNRWDFDALMKSTAANTRRSLEVFQDNYAKVLRTRVNVIAVGELWALVTMPGEPFLAFQMRLADESPIPHTWLLGYTDGYLGYFPTIRVAAEGGYGANGSETWVEVGAGERVVDQALVTLYGFSGKLHKLPRQAQ